MVATFQSNKCYQLNYVTVSEYGGNKVLKASDRSSCHKLQYTAVVLPAVPSIVQTGNITSINLSSFREIKICPQCKSPVDYMRSIPFCKTCDEALVESDLLKLPTIKFTLKDSSMRLPLSWDRKLIQKLCNSPNTDDVNIILCEILNMRVAIKLNPLNPGPPPGGWL